MKIEDAKKCYYACVYCLEFPNGMKYVGKTKDLNKRMGLYLRFGSTNKYLSEAIREFGWDSIEISVLSRVSCNDGVDLQLCLSILEIKYIREQCTLYPSGYNVSLGGECLGVPVEHLTTDKEVVKRFSDGSKCVLCYDLNGDFVKEYPSIANMAYDLGISEECVRSCLNTKKMFAEKWYLRAKRYDYAPSHIEVSLPKCKERIIYKDKIVEREVIKNVVVRRKVEKIVERERKVTKKQHILRYNLDGDFCGEYESMKEACRSFTSSSSGITCGVYRKGYILFRKKDDNIPQKIEPYHVLNKKILGDYYRPASELEDKPIIAKSNDIESKKRGRPRKVYDEKRVPLRVDGKYTNINNAFKVEQYDLDGVLVATHDSIRDASSNTGIRYANIWACVMGRTQKAQGYIWKRID